MRPFVVRPISQFKGEVSLLGDKSIAHRSIITSALACGKTRIENFPVNKDCLYTVKAFKKLGVRITQKEIKSRAGASSIITVNGTGLSGLKKPRGPIFVGDSGTTLRLLLGVLAGQDFKTRVVSGSSLSQRPMLRVTEPLRMMGAKISAKTRKIKQGAKPEEYPPITIKGSRLKPIKYTMPVASAQVKSAIILAALYAEGKTCVIERIPTRDHTERMLKLFKADIKVNPSTTLRLDGKRSRTINKNTIVIKGRKELVSPKLLYIPGDISSAGFFMALASILPNSQILIKNLSLNPSRIGIIRVLKRMGADIKVSRCQGVKVSRFEPAGDLLVKSSSLKGTIVRKKEVPSLIDELPILMVVACNAEGKSVFEGVGELRVKETDRIRSMSLNLARMGADIAVSKSRRSEKIVIRGAKPLKGAKVKSFADHRTAMSLVIAGLAAVGETFIDDVSCINKSFPGFLNLLHNLIR